MVWVWVRRSLRYYGARHLAFAGTVALTAAILCAALLTGESLQAGLRRGLQERLGGTRSAVYLAEGVFPSSLAERLPGTEAALLLRGELLGPDGLVYAANAQFIGVTREQVSLSCSAAEAAHAQQALVTPNARCRELRLLGECGIRFEKPSPYSVEMPLGAVKESRLVRRAAYLLPGARRFNPEMRLPPDFALRAASVPPVNVFHALGPLSEAAGVPGMANLLVSSQSPEKLERALQRALRPEDAGLTVEAARRASPVERPATVVKSRRVFLPQGVCEALAARGLKTERATFHLADSFEVGAHATPYGFVAAVTPGAGGVPGDLKDDELVVNAWLAEVLGVTAGGMVTLRWRRFEPGGRLVPESRRFRVRQVIPMELAAEAKRLMPVFPGLEGVDRCAAWDVGMPMEEEKLNDPANEAYWKEWRETPKAFLTYDAGAACFGAAFGGEMSVRAEAEEAVVRDALRGLTPVQAGFVVRPVWAEGEKVAQGSTDFKGLFVGMAFVLAVAALLLSALSLSLALETRKNEIALFSAIGWNRAKVLAVLVAEWSVPLIAGAAIGAGLGAALARALVWSLGRFWSGAFAGADMRFMFSPPLALWAAVASVMLTLLVLLRAVVRMTKAQPVAIGSVPTRRETKHRAGESVAGCALALAALAVMVAAPGGSSANGAFFGAGLLLMISLLLFVKTAGEVFLKESGGAVTAGLRRAVMVPRRSAPVVVLLAVGTFLTVGILSMKHDPAAGCERPSSGSGGFASIVTSVTALDRERGLELARRVSGAKGVVPVRVREGDEAGCLNMNQPQAPRVMGLDARALARARAFEPVDSGGIWTLIEKELASGDIPALAADQTMLQYSLKAKAGAEEGTVYVYPGATGMPVRVRIVGALPVRSGILQGALLVDERLFAKVFPEESGYRMWLCDYAPYVLREAAGTGGRGPGGPRRSSDLRSPASALRHPEPGVTVETVEERLRLLGSVESTYLDMFLVLGGLGVVLGVAGIALVILRGVQERRGELALLSAVGLPRRERVRLLAAEYGALALTGLLAGIIPAGVAIQPAVRSLGGQLPWGAMALIVAGLFGCAALSVFSAALMAVRRYGPEVLKEEV